jgi:hypothetical protein
VETALSKIQIRKAYGHVAQKRAPSAADMEKVLSVIKYPKARDELISYASEQASAFDNMVPSMFIEKSLTEMLNITSPFFYHY